MYQFQVPQFTLPVPGIQRDRESGGQSEVMDNSEEGPVWVWVFQTLMDSWVPVELDWASGGRSHILEVEESPWESVQPGAD